MNEDVYNKIIDMCKDLLENIATNSPHEEKLISISQQISLIAGVCIGAREREKGAFYDKQEDGQEESNE